MNGRPMDLTALLQEEKAYLIRQMIHSLRAHSQPQALRLAQALQTEFNRVDLSAEQQQQALGAAVVNLRAELLKVQKQSSWWRNLKASQDAAYQTLQDLADYWPLNNKDENQEAEDVTTLFSIGCPLLLLRRSPEELSAIQLSELLGEGTTEAYVSAGDQLYYVNKTQHRVPQLRVGRLRLRDPDQWQSLKVILGLMEATSRLGRADSLRVSENLRQIQMLWITRLTGHDTYNRLRLSSGRQRQADAFFRHLKREPSDPETREIFGKRDRHYINRMARARLINLNGNDQGFTSALQANTFSRANAFSKTKWDELFAIFGMILCFGGFLCELAFVFVAKAGLISTLAVLISFGACVAGAAVVMVTALVSTLMDSFSARPVDPVIEAPVPPLPNNGIHLYLINDLDNNPAAPIPAEQQAELADRPHYSRLFRPQARVPQGVEVLEEARFSAFQLRN